MKGCRPLEEKEIQEISEKLTQMGRHGQRNQLLLLLGCRTGFRISELLSIKVRDAIQHGKAVNRVTVSRCNM